MPTYGYHCDSCETDFDVWQRMTDDSGANCPTCNAPARRLFFPAGIVFKGSGFYRNDSRSADSSVTPSSSSASSSTPAATKSDAKSSGSSDTASGSTTPPAASGDSGSSKPSPSSTPD